MIPLLYQWQNHKGAAHLKKIDTPSLEGCRLRRKWIPIGIRLRMNHLVGIGFL